MAAGRKNQMDSERGAICGNLLIDSSTRTASGCVRTCRSGSSTACFTAFNATVHASKRCLRGSSEWRNNATRETHWRATTRDNITSLYRSTSNSRIADPDDESHVFTWLLDTTYDGKGGLIVYEYKEEDAENVPSALHERNRRITANRHLKRISYGHQAPYFPAGQRALPGDWHFQVVFDYGEHDPANPQADEDVTAERSCCG